MESLCLQSRSAGLTQSWDLGLGVHGSSDAADWDCETSLLRFASRLCVASEPGMKYISISEPFLAGYGE